MASTNPAFTTYNLDGFSLQLPKHRSPSEASSGRRSPSPMRKLPRPSTAPAIEQKPVLPSRPLSINPPLAVNGSTTAEPTPSKHKRKASPLSFSQSFEQEESESQRTLSSTSSDLSASASLSTDSILANSATVERDSAVEESDYDWATFISAYARGKWDPHRTPRPPRSQFIAPDHALYSVPEHSPSSANPTYDEPEPIAKPNIRSSTLPQESSSSSSSVIKTSLTSPVHLSPEYPRNHSLPLVDFGAHRQRNSFSSSPSSNTESSHATYSNPDHQTTAATLRWAAARVNLSPLALPSPEHELTDPMRGVNAAIPGSHPPSYVNPYGNELLTPGGTRRLRPNVFWRGTQDVELRVPSFPSDPDSDTSTETLAPSSENTSLSTPINIPTSLPPASAPIDRRTEDEDEGIDYFGEDLKYSDLGESIDLGSPPSLPGITSTQPALMRLVTVDSGVMSVPAVPRRVCLTRQISSPLPNTSAVDGGPHTPPLPSSSRAVPADYAHFRTRAAKEEQMFHELGFLAAPNPPDELERRRALYKYNIWNTTPDINFDRIARLAKLVFNTKGVFISLMDGSESFYKSNWGLMEHSSARIHSLCGHAILQRGDEPMVVLDTHQDWRFQRNPLVTGSPGIRFYAGAPLRTQDGYNIGTLALLDSSPKEDFSPRQRHTLKEFAAIVIRELELWRDKIQLRIRDRIQTSMEEFSRECLEIDAAADLNEGNRQQDFGLPNMDQVYERAARLIKRTLDVQGVMVMDISYSDVLEMNTLPTDGTIPVVVHTHDSKSGSSSKNLTAEEYAKIKSFFSKYPDGNLFEDITPQSLRPFLPLKIQYALAVPIFNVDKRPFALLCAYNAEGPTKRFLEGHELSYLRAIGVIILSAVLKRRMTLADKAKSLFISNISHELRTPLHGILAAAELLGESEMSHVQASFLETVQACGTSLVETVNHVLDFTKLSGNTKAGGVENSITPTDVDLMHLVEDAVDGCYVGFRARTAESGIGSVYSPPRDVGIAPQALVETIVDVEAPLETWWVKCEKSGIRRVLMNLFSNSLKFTTNGYVRVALRQLPPSSDQPKDEARIELSVSDTGKGISQDFIRNQLFHPFSQENPLQTGTGLGLAIVNSIIQSETVRGKVDVWSEEGTGTEIKITFSAKVVKSEEPLWLIKPFSLGSHSVPTVSMIGFNSSHPGIKLLHDIIENYLVNWFGLELVPEGEPLGQIVFLNNDYSLVVNAIAQRDIQHPFVIFSDVRGDPAAMSIASEYDSIGGFCRILYKPAGPSRLRTVIRYCLHALNISSSTSSEDLTAQQQHRAEPNLLHHLARRKSEEGYPIRPALMPRSATAHPLSTSWKNLPSTFENDENSHKGPLSAPLPSTDSPVDEMPPTVPVGTGGTLLQSSMTEQIKKLNQFRVLVVEDNTILRDLLGKWLTKKGYDYSVAVDGEDGVRTFESQGPFDIVLLDLSMPVLDGVGATMKIRQRELQFDLDPHSKHRPTRILALTGMSTVEDKRRAFDAGVDGYLVKPVAFKTLDEIFSKLGFTSSR